MSGHEQQQGQQATSGFFGRLWGKGGQQGEGKRKAIKANLGERNKLFYDQKLKRWRKEGEEVSEHDLEPPPPPTSGTGFSRGEDKGHRRSVSGSRYADAGSFGRAQPSQSSNAAFLPRPSTAPSIQAPFLPQQATQPGASAASGAPKFFIPGGTATAAAADHIFTPSWGAPSRAQQPVNPYLPASPKAMQQSSRAQQTPKTDPGLKGSSRRDDDEYDEFSWQDWRRKDEEKRERERREAADLGAQIMDSFTETLEADPAETTSFAFTEAAADPEGRARGNAVDQWPSEVTREESVGDNIKPELSARSSATFGAWSSSKPEDEAVTSPAQPAQPFSPIPEGQQESYHEEHTESTAHQFPDSAGVDFFEDTPAVTGEPTFQEWTGEESGINGNAVTFGAEVDSQPMYQNHQVETWEQTYAGLTWSQLQEYAQQYREQGYTEEDVQAWLDGYLAVPDSYSAPAPSTQQAEPIEEAQEAEQQVEVLASISPQTAPQEEQLASETTAAPNLAPQVSGQSSQLPSQHHGEERSQQSAGEKWVASTDLLSQLKEFVAAQRASDPTFGKLIAPLPWEGILTDDEESPNISPRFQLGSGRKKPSAAAEPVVPSIPQIQEFVNTLSNHANNALGASWLDKIKHNLAMDQQDGLQQLAPPQTGLLTNTQGNAGQSAPLETTYPSKVEMPVAIRQVSQQQAHTSNEGLSPSAATSAHKADISREETVQGAGNDVAGSLADIPKAAASGWQTESPRTSALRSALQPAASQTARPQAAKSQSGTPRLGATRLSQSRGSTSAGATPKAAKVVKHATQKDQALLNLDAAFAREDIMSLNSTPRSSRSQAAARSAGPAALKGPDLKAPDSVFLSSASPTANGHHADGKSQSNELTSASLSGVLGADYFALEDGEEASGWEGDEWGASTSWGNGSVEHLADSSHIQTEVIPQPRIADELKEVAHKLPPLLVKSGTPRIQEQTPPISSSKALVAEVEDLKRQLAEVMADRDSMADDFATLQDQNGKLEFELADLKSTIDYQVAEAAERASRTALQVQESVSPLGRASLSAEQEELSSSRAALAEEMDRLAAERRALNADREALEADLVKLSARHDVSSERQGLPEEQQEAELGIFEAERVEIAAQKAILEEEAAQLAAERDDLIQENDRMLADREEFEAERDALSAERETLTSDMEVLSSQREAFAAERESLQAERTALKAELDSLSKKQQDLEDRAASLQQQSAAGTSSKQDHKHLQALQAEVAQLQATAAAMTAENEALAEENLAKDEEIEQLTGQLVHASNGSQVLGVAGVSEDEVKRMREQADLDFHRIAVLMEQNQELQDRIEELEGQAGAASSSQLEALVSERDTLRGQLAAANETCEALQTDRQSLQKAFDELNARSSEAAELAVAFEQERDAVKAQIKQLATQRDKWHRESVSLKKRLSQAESAAANTARLTGEVEELRRQLIAADDAVAAGEDAVAENDSLAHKLANANMKAAALEADLDSMTADRDGLAKEVTSLTAKLTAAETAAAEAAETTSSAEQERLAEELAAVRNELATVQSIADSVEFAKKEANEATSLLSEVQRECKALHARVASLEAELSQSLEAKHHLASLLQERDKLLERVEGLESQLADAVELAKVAAAERDNLASKQEESGRAQEELPQARSDLKAAKSRVEQLQSQLAAVQARADDSAQASAQLTSRVKELEEENGELFDKLSAAEEESDANAGKLSAIGDKLADAERRLASAEAQVADAQAALDTRASDYEEASKEELTRLQAQIGELRAQLQEAHQQSAPSGQDAELQTRLAEKESEFMDLMVCLGQETAKVDALSGLLQQHGVNVQAVIEEVEEKYGWDDDEGASPAVEEVVEMPKQQVRGSAGDLSFLDNPLEDAEGDWSI